MTKSIRLLLTVPDDVDPEEVVETMTTDYYYGNRGQMEERYPDRDVMSNICLSIIDEDIKIIV